MAPLAGMMADALGRKRVIVAALFALSLPTALVATAENEPDYFQALFSYRSSLAIISTDDCAYQRRIFRSERSARMMATRVSAQCSGDLSGALPLAGWRRNGLACRVCHARADTGRLSHRGEPR